LRKQHPRRARSMLKISHQQRQEILHCLHNNQELPDKYRFLLFGEAKQVELLWNGKTNAVCDVVLPFQTIEQVDEPRSEQAIQSQSDLFDTTTGRQLKGWSNKLIWGDNKLILSSLLHGPLRAEIEAQGGLKLIYIDPPFDVGADFTLDIAIGNETLAKEPGVLEQLAYRDTWGKGADSFIAMIYERLILMRDLLAEDGSIYVHCDWRVNSYIRLALDEVFGREQFRNEIIWCYKSGGAGSGGYAKKHDTILYYSKAESGQICFNVSKEKSYMGIGYSTGNKNVILYDDGDGLGPYTLVNVKDWWSDIRMIATSKGRLYPTQKPEALLERIIKASSNKGDLVADFFCGSGTTAAVAEKLGRKWIATDLGKFAIHTTRKRMIGVQRQLKQDSRDYRAFEVLNLGKYERQHYIGVNPNLSATEQGVQLRQKERDYVKLILQAYRAEEVANDGFFQGQKAGHMVAIGPINLPVARPFVETLIAECLSRRITRADILAFEFEMGLFPDIQEEARQQGIDLKLKYIPPDVFDKRAVKKQQVDFYDVAHVDVKIHLENKNKSTWVCVELAGYSAHYSQDAGIEGQLKTGRSKVIVEDGQVIKISKDKNGQTSRTLLTEIWQDWIDYWAVDFDFESKQEIIRTNDPKTGEPQEKPTGDYIFENEWQSFRTRKNRKLEFVSVKKEIMPPLKIAVKVVDIFGNDTMRVMEIDK